MTIITLALTSTRRLALVADRLYSPFSKPQFMAKAIANLFDSVEGRMQP